jgi:hypothetical protein
MTQLQGWTLIAMLALTTFLACPAHAAATPDTVATVRTINPAPIAMTYKDLDSILFDLGQMVEGDSPASGSYLTLSVSGESDSGVELGLELNTWGKLLEAASLPPAANSVSLSYEARSARPAISSVRLLFRDAYREIKITGYDRVRVDAAAAEMQGRFNRYTTSFAGPPFRAALAIIGILVIAMTSSWATSRSLRMLREWQAVVIVLTGIAAIPFLMLFPPWQRWFPGTAIYGDSASFVERHSEAITVTTLLFSIIALIGLWPIIQPALHRARRK